MVRNEPDAAPIPWFNLRLLSESDIRAFHAFIRSLGAPGEKMLEALPPGNGSGNPYNGLYRGRAANQAVS